MVHVDYDASLADPGVHVKTTTMSHQQTTLIFSKQTRDRGRGVFARRPIPADTVIERVPVLVVPAAEMAASGLASYAFSWGRGTVALALGYGSLYNHSYTPNACYQDVGRCTKQFVAIRDIAAGEEITVNYNGEPENRSAVGFEVREP